MKKPILCLILSVLFLLSTGYSAFAYEDVGEGLWYSEAVRFVTEQGWMEGVGDDGFDPDASVTRGMAVTVLWRMAGSPETELLLTVYADLPGDLWYTQAASWAYPEIMVGYPIPQEDPPEPTGIWLTFEGERSLTREQLATVLYRYHELENDTTSAGAELLEQFPDGASVSPWAVEAVCWCVEQGILQGDGAKLDPRGEVTRAQLATVLLRYCEL